MVFWVLDLLRLSYSTAPPARFASLFEPCSWLEPSARALRCRGGLNGGGGLEGFGIWCLTDSPTKNRKRRCPALHSAVASLIAGLAGFLPTAPSGFALGALVFFVLRLADMQRVGGAQAFHPKEDNAPGLVSLRLPIPEAISSLGCHAGGRAARTARAGFGVIL